MRASRCTAVMFAGLVLAGCAGGSANQDSAEYQAGYGDGCATGGARAARLPQNPQRDNELYAKSADYRAGWASGYHVCGPSDNPGHF
jgi:hypothetical protein